MSDDLEAFLRRAADKRAQKTGRSVPDIFISDDGIVEAEPVHENVAEHVASHMDSSGFERRSNLLGGQVSMADDKMDAHLHEVFDHRLGTLEVTAHDQPRHDQPGHDQPGSEAASALPDELRKWLDRPESLPQLFVLSEILPRPEHRW